MALTRRLTAVTLVCEAQGQLAALSHVVDAIDTYVDSIAHCWSLERASHCGDVRLLDRLAQCEWPGVSSSYRQQRFENAVEQAIRVHGHVPVLDWWMTRYLPGQEVFVVNMALQYADVRTLRLLQAKGITIDDSDSEVSCFTLEAAQWFHENLDGLRLKLMVNCVPNNDSDHFEYLQWAVAHRNEYSVFGLSYAMDSAAWNGQLEVLQWMHKATSERCSAHTLGHAAQEGCFGVVRWLYENYPKQYFNDPWETPSDVQLIQWLASEYKWQSERARIAWISNSIHVALQPSQDEKTSNSKWHSLMEVIQLLYSIRPDPWATQSTSLHNTRPRILHNRCRYEPRELTDAMDEAAANGHLEIVKWMHNHYRDDGCTTQAMDRAAAQNHLDVVQWLHHNRSEGCTTDAMDSAIAGNHLEMVQWLHANRSEGCTARAMDEAAGCGHLEMVRWLHLNRAEGCTKNAMKYAAVNGRLEVVKWLHENRTEGCTSDAMDLAAQEGELEVLQFLEAYQQASWSRKAVEKAAANGHLRVVKWFLGHQISFCDNTSALRGAAFRGHFEIVKLLVEPGYGIEYDAAFVAEVIECGHFKTAEWLEKQYSMMN